MVSLKYQ